MAPIDPAILEMPEHPSSGVMPPFGQLPLWLQAEVAGLNEAQLDLDDLSPEREWLWWSIRRQVSLLEN